MKTDFHYHHDSTGFFYTIWPNNRQAENALSEYMKLNNCSNHVLVMHFTGFKSAIKTAGYTIRKVKPATHNKTAAEILEELAK